MVPSIVEILRASGKGRGAERCSEASLYDVIPLVRAMKAVSRLISSSASWVSA